MLKQHIDTNGNGSFDAAAADFDGNDMFDAASDFNEDGTVNAVPQSPSVLPQYDFAPKFSSYSSYIIAKQSDTSYWESGVGLFVGCLGIIVFVLFVVSNPNVTENLPDGQKPAVSDKVKPSQTLQPVLPVPPPDVSAVDSQSEGKTARETKKQPPKPMLSFPPQSYSQHRITPPPHSGIASDYVNPYDRQYKTAYVSPPQRAASGYVNMYGGGGQLQGGTPVAFDAKPPQNLTFEQRCPEVNLNLLRRIPPEHRKEFIQYYEKYRPYLENNTDVITALPDWAIASIPYHIQLLKEDPIDGKVYRIKNCGRNYHEQLCRHYADETVKTFLAAAPKPQAKQKTGFVWAY